MTASEWQRRRGELNHDWLGNQLLPALAKFHRVLSGEVEDAEFTRRFQESVLQQWNDRVPDLIVLLDEYEIAMSPRTLVEDQCAGEYGANYGWLASHIHSLWMVRCCVDLKVSEGRERLRHAQDAFLGLSETIRKGPIRSTSNLISYLQTFRSSCMALSDSIHSLEKDVELV
jgi:hypothetical protein